MTFRLEKNLMTLGCRKLDDLVFDGRAVPRTARRDRAAIHRRLPDVLGDDVLPGLAEEGDPAGELRRVSRVVLTPTRRGPEMRPRVVELLDLAFLSLESRQLDRSAVDTWRRSRLESRDLETNSFELLGEMCRRCFASATTGELVSRFRCECDRAEMSRS